MTTSSHSTSRSDHHPTRGAACDPPRRWDASLELGFRRDARRTTLALRRHKGPLGVQRPFYPEPDGTCHVYLLHPPGGVAGGDALVIDAHLGAGAQALLTTPAAGKLYRCDTQAGPSHQTQRFDVADGACLEWLPQETIVFDAARSQLATRVELAQHAQFLGWEVLCLGRPAAGERFEHGRVRQAFEVYREGRPMFVERGLYEGGAPVLEAPWGLSNQPIMGTMVCVTPAVEGLVEQLRDALPPNGKGTAQGHFSVSQLREVLVCRYLGARAESALQGFRMAWGIVRTAVYGRQPREPRIWLT
ncbi:MAG: urease accessory protein UreD [Myxococcales bacterium]|nr:urease accessory protein UreD [Myxococcales bacterium]